jgi:hypothetical protein
MRVAAGQKGMRADDSQTQGKLLHVDDSQT